ncbi:MAG: hypothetical protein ACW967_02490 [Candidatus Hodarchaeales archaeon]
MQDSRTSDPIVIKIVLLGDYKKKVLILANKIDLRKGKAKRKGKRTVKGLTSTEEGNKLMKTLPKDKDVDYSFFETSALNGENIEEVFDSICEFQLTE